MTFGSCKYCGQTANLMDDFKSQQEADDAATAICGCSRAESERRIKEKVDYAKEQIQELFGEESEELQFRAIDEDRTILLLNDIVELTARRCISSSTILIHGYCKAKISYTGKGKIKVERSETHSEQREAGE